MYEGVASVVLEGMAAGLAVVVSDVGGHKEVVTPQTGILGPAPVRCSCIDAFLY